MSHGTSTWRLHGGPPDMNMGATLPHLDFFTTPDGTRSVSPCRTGSPVSLDERYYQYSEAFFSDPVTILNAKRLDPRGKFRMPTIVITTQEGRTGSPVENWMAPLGADDEEMLIVPEHECGLTEEEELQIALDQEQWELEEDERRRAERRRIRQQRKQQRENKQSSCAAAANILHGVSAPSAATAAQPAKKKKKKTTVSRSFSSGSHHSEPIAAAVPEPAADAPVPPPKLSHYRERAARDAPPLPPTALQPPVASTVSHFQLPSMVGAIQPLPTGAYRPAVAIPQTVAELTTPRSLGETTPRQAKRRDETEACLSVTHAQDTPAASAASADPAPCMLTNLKRIGSWSLKTGSMPAPQTVASPPPGTAAFSAHATTPPVVSKPVHREVKIPTAWTPSPAPPPALASAMVVDTSTYVVSALAVAGCAAVFEKVQQPAVNKKLGRHRLQQPGDNAEAVAALAGAVCAWSIDKAHNDAAALVQASAYAIACIAAAVAAETAGATVEQSKRLRLAQKQMFVQTRLMEGRETSARIRVSSLEAEQRALTTQAFERFPSPIPEPEIVIPMPLRQTPKPDSTASVPTVPVAVAPGPAVAGTPAQTATPACTPGGRPYKPSLFKAENGFSLTFGKMQGRFGGAASPMPVPNSESRIPRMAIQETPLKPGYDTESEATDSESERDTTSEEAAEFTTDVPPPTQPATPETVAKAVPEPETPHAANMVEPVPAPVSLEATIEAEEPATASVCKPTLIDSFAAASPVRFAIQPHAGRGTSTPASLRNMITPDCLAVQVAESCGSLSVTPPVIGARCVPFGETPAWERLQVVSPALTAPEMTPVQLIEQSCEIIVPRSIQKKLLVEQSARADCESSVDRAVDSSCEDATTRDSSQGQTDSESVGEFLETKSNVVLSPKRPMLKSSPSQSSLQLAARKRRNSSVMSQAPQKGGGCGCGSDCSIM